MVVFADQYSWQLPKSRYVEGLKELALVRGTITIEGKRSSFLFPILLREGETASKGNLGADDTVATIEIGVLLVEMHGSALPAGAPSLAAHELRERGDEVAAACEVGAVIAVRGDDGIGAGDGGLHPDGDGLLAVVEVAEPADELGLIEGIRGDLHPAHHGHVAEEGEELGRGGGDVARGRVDDVGGEGDRGLDGERRRGVRDRARRDERRGLGPRGGDAAEEDGRSHGYGCLGFRGGDGEVDLGVGGEEGDRKRDFSLRNSRCALNKEIKNGARLVGVDGLRGPAAHIALGQSCGRKKLRVIYILISVKFYWFKLSLTSIR